MSDKRPISDEPKRAPKMIRVIFKPGTSSKEMAAELVRLREVEAGRPSLT